MDPYRILPECFHHPSDGTCYHYCLSDNEYSVPIIHKCQHIHNNVEIIGGNVFIGIDDEFWNDLTSRKPEIPETPILVNRPIVHTKFANLFDTTEIIVDLGSNECEGIYIRDSITLHTIEIIYDFVEISTHYYRRIIYQSDPNDDENMVKYLLSQLSVNNDELVIVLSDTVKDKYIRKITDNLYLMVTIDK